MSPLLDIRGTPVDGQLPFAFKILTLVQSNEFLALSNLANTPETFARVVRTAIVLGDFIDRAVQILTATPPGQPAAAAASQPSDASA